MIVTDKEYYIDDRMVSILDKIALRLTVNNPKWDYPLLCDGYEGYGKSNIMAGYAYYIAYKTGREFTIKHVFFDPEEMIRYALSNENKIILWDEAAFAALAMQGADALQVTLIKMLMIARKKRHFYIINIPRFYRLKEAIIERCMGLIHVYARNETEIGRFCFYRKASLEALYEDWKRTRRKPKYNKFVTAHGTFSEALPKVLNEQEYDAKKDAAILSLTDELDGKKSKTKMELDLVRYAYATLEGSDTNRKAEIVGVTPRTIQRWAEKVPANLGKRVPRFIDQRQTAQPIIKGYPKVPSPAPPESDDIEAEDDIL